VKRLLTALGVDHEQWKALTIVALKLDLRTSSFGARGRRAARRSRAIAGQLMFYVLLGAFMAALVYGIGDRFLAATVVFSYVIFMVGTAMLVDHNAAIISPADYGILGFQPITSRTWFAVRLTNVLVYTLGMTTALGLLPTGALAIRYGPWIGIAAFIALYTCAITVTLAVVVLYASFMRRFGADRLKRVLSWVQMFSGFVVYGGYFFTSEAISKSALSAFRLTRTTWLMLYPATWFASYLEVADGSSLLIDLIPVVASVGFVVFLASRLGGRLSFDYAERLGELAAATAPAPSRTRSAGTGFWFRRGESRAVAILVRGHFRNDTRFRMGVLAIVPITVMYLFIGLRKASANASTSVDSLMLVTMAALFFPTLLKQNLDRSDAFRAAWVFFASPADRSRLMGASKNVLVATFVVPYLLFVGVFLSFFTHNVLYISVYLVMVGLASHLALLFMTLVEPGLPFAKPVDRTRSSTRIFLTMIGVGLVAAFLPVLSRVIYSSAAATAATFFALILITLGLARAARHRIARQAEVLEFDG
jgi:ABC-2 type transport system permease protein